MGLLHLAPAPSGLSLTVMPWHASVRDRSAPRDESRTCDPAALTAGRFAANERRNYDAVAAAEAFDTDRHLQREVSRERERARSPAPRPWRGTRPSKRFRQFCIHAQVGVWGDRCA